MPLRIPLKNAFLQGSLDAQQQNIANPVLVDSITAQTTYIVPVMRHSTTTGSETFGLSYTADNFATFQDLFAGDLATAPSKGLRDPALLQIGSKWYAFCTLDAFSNPSHYFRILVSTDGMATWTTLTDVLVPNASRFVWAPKPFYDKRRNRVVVAISTDRATAAGKHDPRLGFASVDDLTTWTGWAVPGGLEVPPVFYDFQLSTNGIFYYAIGVVSGSAPSLAVYRSLSLTSGWTLFSSFDFGGGAYVEQCNLEWLGADAWRIIYFGTVAQRIYERFSQDGMVTWTPARLLFDVGADSNKRSFVQTIPTSALVNMPTPEAASGGAALDGVAYVDGTSGSDSTAVVGNRARPYLTADAALTASASIHILNSVTSTSITRTVIRLKTEPDTTLAVTGTYPDGLAIYGESVEKTRISVFVRLNNARPLTVCDCSGTIDASAAGQTIAGDPGFPGTPLTLRRFTGVCYNDGSQGGVGATGGDGTDDGIGTPAAGNTGQTGGDGGTNGSIDAEYCHFTDLTSTPGAGGAGGAGGNGVNGGTNGATGSTGVVGSSSDVFLRHSVGEPALPSTARLRFCVVLNASITTQN